jgi:hypothetical protein
MLPTASELNGGEVHLWRLHVAVSCLIAVYIVVYCVSDSSYG